MFGPPAVDSENHPMLANAPLTFRIDDYELMCGTLLSDSGRFQPTLTISRCTWPSRPRNIAVAGKTFETESAAIEAARAQGLEWIKNYG
ncbi:MAG TPA: hypothetical protein VNU71_12775 [Burkholderiaceae bacterium]|nr:hypothetical protein [Burkholderiaceae bacterium]